MFNRPYVAATLLAALVISPAAPALGAGEILLTHAKALAGNVTPGDAPGYPITLSLPGTYQFSGNVHPTANTIGISIGSDDVTIDLNGFRLHGSTTAFFGIAGSARSVTIKNGTITGFKFDGIFGTGDYWVVENMRIVQNDRDGISLGSLALIQSSLVADNNARGIRTGSFSIIQENTVSRNLGVGIETSASTVVANTISYNGSLGLTGGGTTGYGDNTLQGNNPAGGSVEALNVVPMNPNACSLCP